MDIKSATTDWYSRKVFSIKTERAKEDEELSLGNEKDLSKHIACPRCKAAFPFGPFFDPAPRMCPSCKIKITEWELFEILYLIDYEQAPKIIKLLIDHFEGMYEYDAEAHLVLLLNFLGISNVSSLHVTIEDKKDWYIPLSNLKDVACPRCKGLLSSTVFDSKTCSFCKSKLTKWNLANGSYLIDIEKAPDIIKVLLKYLEPFSELDANSELKVLLCFLGVLEGG